MITEDKKKQLELENKKIADNIHNTKHRIVVFSGKGGVGKTTVSVNLAGTGDEILTMAQNMEPDMAIIVTTPQELSLIDSVRAISMAKKMNIPKITLIENMSGLICPKCGHRIELFGIGGGKKQAEEMNIAFLGAIPINLEARKLADEGKPIVIENKEADISVTIFQIVKKIEDIFNESTKASMS